MTIAEGQGSGQPAPAGLAAYLPALNEEQARRAHTLARCLRSTGRAERVEVTALDDSDELYIGAALAWRPGPHRRAPAGADGARLAAVLDEAEDWLDDVEAASGLAAEFTRYGTLEHATAAVRLLAADASEEALLVPLAAPRPVLAAVPRLTTLNVEAARLSLDEAEALGPGDLLLLYPAPWRVAIRADGFAPPAIVFDPATGQLSPSRLHPQETSSMSADKPPLQVPVSLRLPDVLLSQEELAKLADGGTLSLGPVGEGLTVELLIAGRPLAKGELVTLGDRFAVLLGDPADGEAPAAAHEEDA